MIDLVDAMIGRGATKVSITVAGVTCSVEGLRTAEPPPPAPRAVTARDAIEEAKRRAADVERVLFPPEPEE